MQIRKGWHSSSKQAGRQTGARKVACRTRVSNFRALLYTLEISSREIHLKFLLEISTRGGSTGGGGASRHAVGGQRESKLASRCPETRRVCCGAVCCCCVLRRRALALVFGGGRALRTTRVLCAAFSFAFTAVHEVRKLGGCNVVACCALFPPCFTCGALRSCTRCSHFPVLLFSLLFSPSSALSMLSSTLSFFACST